MVEYCGMPLASIWFGEHIKGDNSQYFLRSYIKFRKTLLLKRCINKLNFFLKKL